MIVSDVLKDVRILLAEDNVDLLEVLADGLEMFGAQTLRAQNGQEGLNLLSSHQVDVIISDVRMPVMDGREFLRALKNLNIAFPPFLFLTGFTDLTPEVAVAEGAAGMFYKPIRVEKLAQTAASILAERRKKQGK